MKFEAAIRRRIGELVIGGDWACAHGDAGALGYLARELSEYVAEPLHRELVALANLCDSAPDDAAHRWPQLREQVRADGPPR